jgi:hypothetical protein
MTVLCSIVEALVLAMLDAWDDLSPGRAVTGQLVREV